MKVVFLLLIDTKVVLLLNNFMPNYRNVDVSPLFRAAGLETRGLQPIHETSKMYPFKNGDVTQNWSYFMISGLRKLQETLVQNYQKLPENIGIVGIGSGVEGIAAARIFHESIRRLFVTDIDQKILEGAVSNIKRNVDTKKVEVVGHVGSFAEPLEAKEVQLDLIAGNVPNLPSAQDQKLRSGADLGTFMPRGLYEKYTPPEKFVKWALGAQYAYLTSASRVVREGGSALTLVGGRFPLPLVKELFEAAGFGSSNEVIAGYKEQTEPEPDFKGYSKFEAGFTDVSFDFYVQKAAEQILANANIENPTSRHTGVQIKGVLKDQRKSALAALVLYPQGISCGHTVHLFQGVK